MDKLTFTVTIKVPEGINKRDVRAWVQDYIKHGIFPGPIVRTALENAKVVRAYQTRA